MSEVDSKPTVLKEVGVEEPTNTNATTTTTEPTETTTETKTEEASKTEPTTTTEAPATEASKPEETAAESKDEAATEEKKDEAEPAAAEKKPVEPITEGQLALKGPGLLKSIIPSKKEFWLSDEAVSPQDLNSYMRGEKPEVAHPVVAWASQTGKGLLFFNKKGETNKKQPGHVLALYDASDLQKESPHEIHFKLGGQELVLKAVSDNERDGWYMSLEKSIEAGKAQKDEIRESEGYKAEMEKLNKPSVGAAGVAKSTPKKSTEVTDKPEAAERKNSEPAEDEEKKDKKSRSTSRGGVLGRFKYKKDELETKKEEKKEEKEESKPEEENKTEESKTEETTAAAGAGAATAAGAAAVAGASSSDDKKEEDKKDEATEPKTEEKAKPSKRGSIFGKMQGWGGVKSPAKEKEQKDAELKPEVPPKDNAVSENPPVLPETTTDNTEAAEASKTETEAKPENTEAATPGKEKSNFLSGLPFMNKRNRSVSPATNMKEAPAKADEAAPAEVPNEAEPVEEGKADEAVAETTAVEPLKPEAESTPNKRQSMLGSLGRRASKAFKGMQQPKKENATPAAEATKETNTTAAAAEETPATNGETRPAESTKDQQHIGDVVPGAVSVGRAENQPATVTASA